MKHLILFGTKPALDRWMHSTKGNCIAKNHVSGTVNIRPRTEDGAGSNIRCQLIRGTSDLNSLKGLKYDLVTVDPSLDDKIFHHSELFPLLREELDNVIANITR